MLPRPARAGLVAIWREIEAKGAWPWQALLVLVTLLRKPTGGDRCIGILPELGRLWASARAPCADAWIASRAGAWDLAVAGSSSLRCALVRAFCDET
eukprot:414741-Lingulodinium_polyedra.AAC.1